MTDDLKNIIGKNIKKYRNVNNETSQQLAESIETSQSTISDWENGKKMPRAGAIEKLAEHWKIPKSKILNDDNTFHDVNDDEQELITSFRKQTEDMNDAEIKNFNNELKRFMKISKEMLNDDRKEK